MDRAMWHIPDWTSGTEELSAEQEYIYFRLCLHVYQFDGLLKDDDRANARRCKVSMQRFRRIKADLIAAAKIEVIGGLIWNGRCQKVMKKTAEISDMARAKINRRWEKERQKGAKSRGKSAKKTTKKTPINTPHNSEKANDINETGHTGEYTGDHTNSITREEDTIPKGIDAPEGAHEGEPSVWKLVVEYLVGNNVPEGNSRSIVGRWRKDGHTDGQIIDAMEAAKKVDAVEPISFMTAVLARRDGEDDDSDLPAALPRDEWSITMYRAGLPLSEILEHTGGGRGSS